MFRNVESVAGGVTELVNRLDAMGPDAMIPGSDENNRANAIRAQLSTEIPKLKSMQIGAKRVNEAEADRAEEMISDPTAFRQAMAGGVRNQEFFKTLKGEMERNRKQNLWGYSGTGRFNFQPVQ